jgi:hypothetical protein
MPAEGIIKGLNWYSSHNSSSFCIQKFYFLSKNLYYLKIDASGSGRGLWGLAGVGSG